MISKTKTLAELSIGFVLKIFFKRIEVKNIVLIGSSSGFGFNDNGKHLFQYWSNRNNNVYFVTKSIMLYKQLRGVYGDKILYNYSFTGLSKILRAKYYFFTHNEGDVNFVHNTGTKKICLFHGMPIKCIGYDYKGKGVRKNPLISNLYRKYVIGFTPEDFHMVVSTSGYFNKYLSSAFRNDRVSIMSYPRNNYLEERIQESATGVKKGKRKILYMPTHRDYGYGNLNPTIFFEDKAFLKFLDDNNFDIRYRFHPNMKKALKELDNYSVIEPMLDKNLDAQDALFETDILISDFSSCVFDYLICEKPIVFYHYDNYENDDNGIYYDIKSLNMGPIVKNELDLKNVIKKIASDKNYEKELIDNIKNIRCKYLEKTNGWMDYQQFLQ